MNLGAAFAGGNGARRENDFYPTPPEATHALIDYFDWQFPAFVWEPACGDGAMAKVLKERGVDVIAADLVDRGYGVTGVDFLEATTLEAPAIVTNPPFKLAAQFIEKAHALQVEFLALLLKATFFNAAKRRPLFMANPPARVLPLTWRLDFTGQESPTMDCAWFVWRRGDQSCRFEPLERPK